LQLLINAENTQHQHEQTPLPGVCIHKHLLASTWITYSFAAVNALAHTSLMKPLIITEHPIMNAPDSTGLAITAPLHPV